MSDRRNVCDVISEMLDNPNEHGIYPTSLAYARLISLIQDARIEAIGWAHADDCVDMDHDRDPRKKDMTDLLKRAKEDLGFEEDLDIVIGQAKRSFAQGDGDRPEDQDE